MKKKNKRDVNLQYRLFPFVLSRSSSRQTQPHGVTMLSYAGKTHPREQSSRRIDRSNCHHSPRKCTRDLFQIFTNTENHCVNRTSRGQTEANSKRGEVGDNQDAFISSISSTERRELTVLANYNKTSFICSCYIS